MENGFGIMIKLFYNSKYCFKAFTSTVQEHSRRLHFVKSCGCARCVGFRFAQKLPAAVVPACSGAGHRLCNSHGGVCYVARGLWWRRGAVLYGGSMA